MKLSVSSLLVVPAILAVTQAVTNVTPAASCTANACLNKVNKNLNNNNHGCDLYKPTTRTPKKTHTSTVITRVNSRTVTKPTTVTDRTKTATSTATSTNFVATTTKFVTSRSVDDDALMFKRAQPTQTPLAVPGFAKNYCSNYAQMSSACACFGHTRTLVIAPKSTTVKTVTKGGKATVTKTHHATTTTTTMTTTTVDGTKTVTSTVAADPSNTNCANQGMQFANYANPYGESDGNTYPDFNVEYFKTSMPRDTGVTYNVANFDKGPSGDITIYDDYEFDVTYFMLQQRGYIYPSVSGTYDWKFWLNADDIALLWVGDKAYSGFGRDDYDAYSTYGYNTGSFTIDLQAGTYYPFRLMYANAQTNAGYHFRLVNPNGNEILNDGSTASSEIVQYSCDLVSAPKFPDFGSES